MDPLTVGVISVILIVAAVILGIHIAVALALVSIFGLWLILGDLMVPVKMLGSAAFHGVFEYAFCVVPMFVLMGFLASLSGAAEDAYGLAASLLGKRRGGLAIATVAANAVFAAITGISVASAALFSRVSLGPMISHGYDKKLSLGTIAGSSILGMLIPPSVLLILYGIVAQESIGALFAAGILPGILLALVYSAGLSIMVRLKPSLVRSDNTSTNNTRTGSAKPLAALPIVFLIGLVLGGILYRVVYPDRSWSRGRLRVPAAGHLQKKTHLDRPLEHPYGNRLRHGERFSDPGHRQHVLPDADHQLPAPRACARYWPIRACRPWW